MRAAIVTISDKAFVGQREDSSGPILARALSELGAVVIENIILPDEQDRIAAELMRLADELRVDLVVTTGGTGPAARDRTPEATRAVIEREMPGLAEVLRFQGYQKTPWAVLSRGLAGIRGACLIINLPGNPKAVLEGMEVLAAILPHAVQMIRGENLEHEGSHHA